MVEKNIVDAVVIPETPKVQEGAVEMVYVPIATNNTKGIASYDEAAFKVIDGKVHINSEYIKDNIEDELGKGLGEIPICCACQTMINKSTGSTITTSMSPVTLKAGNPVVGQYALYSNGVALVESVSENNFTATVIAYHYIKINDDVSTTETIYAPTKAGTAGQVLVSTTKEPIWRTLSINGSKMTSDKTIYAPTAGGTAGQVLVSTGPNTAPAWENAPTGGGSSGSSADIGKIQFCCFANMYIDSTSIGSIHDVLKSSILVGEPIVGQYAIVSNVIGEVTEVTDSNFKFKVRKNHTLRINGTTVPDYTPFYTPTKAGTAGQVLVSQGSGKEPVWSDAATGGSSGSTKGYKWSSTWDSSAILVEITTVDSTFVVPVDSHGNVDAYVSGTEIDKKMWYSDKYDDKGNYKGSEYDSGLNEVYLYTYRITGNCPSLYATRNTFIISKNTYDESDHFEPGGYNMKLYEFGAWLNVYNKKYLVKEK